MKAHLTELKQSMSMSKAELVFIPAPGRGHLLSTIEVAKLIVKNNPHISILVIIFRMPNYKLNAIDDYLESQSCELDRSRFTLLTLPPLSNPPDPASTTFFHSVIELQKPLVKQALSARLTKPAAFVLDMLCVSFMDIADDLGVPSYIYFTAGASLLNLMLHVQELVDDEGVDVMEHFESNSELELPGFRNRVPVYKVLPATFTNKEGGWFTFILGLSRGFRRAKGVLINTFEELESYGINTLHSQDRIRAVYPIGPVVALDEKCRDNGPEKKGQEVDSIMQWLDVQPSASVVFLCFGSMGSFDAAQVKEIANGLERTGHRFLWSLRRPVKREQAVFPSEDETFVDALPEGFLDGTTHIGKIIGWAPQVQILAHRAIGGFVSHCGWNSILESLWFGVPIATWPMYSEQQLNAFELVKELGLSVEIRMDYMRDLKKDEANFMVTTDEVESGVNKLMSLDDKMRNRVKDMSDKSRKGLEKGGSSHEWLNRFITEVLNGVVNN